MDKHDDGVWVNTAVVEYWGLNAPTVERQEWSSEAGRVGGRPTGTQAVTTTILSGVPGPAAGLVTGVPQSGFCVRVRVWIPSDVAYMLIADADGTGLSFHRMDEVGQGRWSLTLRLRAATYRYRYYTDGGQSGPRVTPDQSAEALAHLDGNDAQFTVPWGKATADRATMAIPRTAVH
jgi:hypothetical protein